MPDAIKLSIVTPCYNSIHTLRETLESVANQDYPHFEHIVVDGGSKDGTLDIIKSFPKVRWISEKDEGHYHAMNKGIHMATGYAVNILNADDCFCPGVLTKVARAFEEHRDWDALFGDYIYIDDEGKEIFRREEACWDRQAVWCGFPSVNHQTLFVRKATYERLGPLRHKDFKNCCDYEFLYRMARSKCNVGHVRDYFLRYRFHQHGQSADLRILQNMHAETAAIRQEYGVPGGMIGKGLRHYARLKRQWNKLRILGKCDLIPGKWYLSRHMREKTTFSSNIGLDKL